MCVFVHSWSILVDGGVLQMQGEYVTAKQNENGKMVMGDNKWFRIFRCQKISHAVFFGRGEVLKMNGACESPDAAECVSFRFWF